MPFTIDDFFKPVKLTKVYGKKDYKTLVPVIEFAKSISHLTYQSIYLIDYYKRGFVYVSENPIFLCGNSSDEVLNDGYLHYFNNVPESDLEMLNEINTVGHSFYNSLPNSQKLDYFISYDFHLNQPYGKPILINHKLTPIILDEKCNPWIALCFVSISSQSKPGNVVFKNNVERKQFLYDFKIKEWTMIDYLFLKKTEKAILLYSAQGYTMTQIAEQLFLSVDTVKYYKRSIFAKLNVKSISEAIAKSLELTLI